MSNRKISDRDLEKWLRERPYYYGEGKKEKKTRRRINKGKILEREDERFGKREKEGKLR